MTIRKSYLPQIIAFGFAAMLVAGIVYYFSGAGAPMQMPAMGVVIAPVTQETWVDTIEAIGTARANESVNITAKVSDKVSQLSFTDGMQVQAGDVLVTLGNEEQQARVSQAEANLREQRKDYARVKPLVASKALPAAKLDERESMLRQAEARLREVKAQLGDHVIAAPFSGVLGLRMVSLGAFVSPGMLITTLDDVSLIKLDFTVPETYLSRLTTGLEVEAKSQAYPDKPFTGNVVAVDSRVDPVTRAVTVRAEIPNPELALRGGMLLSVVLRNAPRQVLSIPEAALMPLQDKQFVFVIDNEKKAQKIEVTIGERRTGTVEIRQGLEPGQQVVVEGNTKIQPGMTVNIVPTPGAPAAQTP